MTQEWINTIDLIMGTALLTHIIHQMIVSKRLLNRINRICKLSSRKKRMGYSRILCNALFGSERMSWNKITASTLLFTSFMILTLHEYFFGLVGMISVGVMGSIKIYYSLPTHTV